MSILAVNPERVHVRGRPSIKACGKNELSTISHPHYIFSPLEERKEKKINGSFLYSKIWENGLANAFFVGYSRVFCVCFDYFFLFSFSEAFVFPSLSRIFCVGIYPEFNNAKVYRLPHSTLPIHAGSCIT